ncbi:MAG: hypothetical protein H7332_17485 [Bdellovibrionales bacterium]|nr:hypothetical protein [Ramlibacter sp.]
MNDFKKCAIGASDGDIGHVKDRYFDDDAWLDFSREAIKQAAHYDPSTKLNRHREMALYTHDNRQPCWKTSFTPERMT